MVEVLKLQKAVYAIILGVLSLIIAQVMSSHRVTGSSYVLGLSGMLLIIGSLLFLYPILFAKKADKDGEKVELKAVGEETATEEETN